MCRNSWREHGCYSCLFTLPRFNCRYPFKPLFLLPQIHISANNAENSTPKQSARSSFWKEDNNYRGSQTSFYVKCNSRIHCNLVGASEMGEGGLDQLKISCITVGKPFWRRDAGFAGVVTAVSAFESPEVIPKRKSSRLENLKSKYHSLLHFSPLLTIFFSSSRK